MSQDPDEDLIEATIRRVAASKAARLPDVIVDAPDPGEGDRAGGPDLHIVPADDPPHVAPPARPAADESLIEATLRRIEAQQAARAAEAASGEPAVHETASQPEHAPDLHLVRFDDDTREDVASPRVDAAQGPAPGDPASAPAWSDIAALRRDLDDTRRQVRELSERLGAMLAAPPDQPRPSHPEPARPAAPASVGASDDDWDDAPVIARMDTGLPPRPPILRDPSPTPAPATRTEDLGPAAVASSAVRPSGSSHVDAAPKRGFDLLPRTYRITVEDKRRGVDLVPLHRALLGMAGVRDMSLLSYSNGTAIVALESTAEIASDALGAAVAHAMAREVKVEVHNEQTMVVKLAED